MAATVPAKRGSSALMKPYRCEQQEICIEQLGAVGLHERGQPLVEGFRAHIAMNSIGHRFPVLDRPFQLELLRALHRAVECHPGHHLRVGETLRWSAHFPHTVVGPNHMPSRCFSN